MSQTETTPDDVDLQMALEENEFDIAGLADFCAEQKCIDQCLRQLYHIIRRNREPVTTDKNLLAQVLVGMLYVARNDYAAEGHQEYWPFLFGRIRKAAFSDPEKFWNEALSGQQYQSLLGRWFLCALEAFGYSVPSGGQKYVGPIVFHAGMPCSSLPRVMMVIAAACDQFGHQAISLPADIRTELVTNHFLHRNVERLLSSNLQGAAQLWGCLARVVLAWKTLGDCNDELRQLPLALDPDEVRAALPLESETPRVPRAALPQLRYDSETGEIRLTFPRESSTAWRVTSDGHPLELSWSRTHLGQTAEFTGPLPEQILVEPAIRNDCIGRAFSPYPSDWPGCWFHAHNGNLEDGLTIDASGIGSGRWFVLFEGTPTKCSVPFIGQVQLKWSWFKGNQAWTAWEVEVPPRTASRTHLEWCVGDNCFRVPLARRPGPRVEFADSPVAKATTLDGNAVDVYSNAPTVILRRETPIALQLLEETTDSVAVIGQVDLRPDTVTRLPVTQAGVYQLRESRGVGRTLLRFAVVPELQIQGPDSDSRNLTATVTVSAADDAGFVCDSEDTRLTKDGRRWSIQSTTVQPTLKARWCWSTDDIPQLMFRWPVEAMRWRITHAGEEYSGWTRELLFISPTTVAEHDAQLEIQTPAGSQLLVNGEIYAGRVQASPTGNMCVLSLLSYGETVELEHGGERYAAVLQSERPLIDSLECDGDTESVIISWEASSEQSGLVVVAWDPCEALAPAKLFPLSATELNSAEWACRCDALPGEDWTSISIARPAGGFLQKALHFAAQRSEALEPVSVLVNRTTGAVTRCKGRPSTWPEFLHHVSLLRLTRHSPDGDAVTTFLSSISDSHTIDLRVASRLVLASEALLDDHTTRDRDRHWAQAIHGAVLELVRRVCSADPGRALTKSDAPDLLTSLLTLGIPLGRFYPFRWLATGELLPDSSPYPLSYIRDLWLLGTGRRLFEEQLKECGETLPQGFEEMQGDAARRVLQFHETNALPPISAFLPLGRGTASTGCTDRGHRHSFTLPPLPESITSPDDFCELLGFQDKALDCQATCVDQFFDIHSRAGRGSAHGRGGRATGPAGYSLYWCADENRWAIETPNRSSPTCCYTNAQPLLVEPIPAKELADTCVRDALVRWTRDECFAPECTTFFAFLQQHRNELVDDPISGALHAELFRPAETETKELFGRTIQVESRSDLSQLAVIAWQLAWIDRVSAWEGDQHVLGQTDANPLIQREFLRGLALAMTRWPTLMRRTLALAELVYWSLYRGGIGAAARFRSDHTESHFAVLRKSAAALEDASASPAAPTKPKGDRVNGVVGIIVGYNAGIGIVLLQHRSSPSLDATVSDYVAHGDAERHWFASFRWRAVDVDARERLQRLHSQRTETGRRSPHSTLADVMCGMRVICDLQKKPKWEAVDVMFDFGTAKAQLPKDRRRQPN